MRFAVACLILAPMSLVGVALNLPKIFGKQSDESCHALFLLTIWTIVGIYSFAGLIDVWHTL